jgi:hypothetical protein
MSGHHPTVGIKAAAGAPANDETHSLALVKLIGQNRARRDEPQSKRGEHDFCHHGGTLPNRVNTGN